MPKFNLYEKSTGLPGDTPARVEVGWTASGGGHVQIATCSDNLENLRALGKAAAPEQEDWRGIFMVLDRDGINELIRNLRIARDKAFGRDE
jgi:hypothetical protein